MKKISIFIIILIYFSFLNYSFADNQGQIDAAYYLSQKNIIKNYSLEPEKFNINSNITRIEVLKLVLKISGQNIENKCMNKFLDLPKSHWGCKYAETALDLGLIKNNKYFRPDDKISKGESLKLVINSLNLSPIKDSSLSWQENYIKFALDKKIISDKIENYNEYEVRGFLFLTLANILRNDDDLDSSNKDSESTKALDLGYVKQDNSVYWGNKKIEGADYNSFQIIAPSLGKDNAFIYSMGDILNGADVNTFKILNNYYAKDKNNIYYLNDNYFYYSGFSHMDNNVDIDTFKVLDGTFGKDKNNIYNLGKILDNFDKDSFEVIKTDYVKDKNNVYFCDDFDCYTLEGIDKDSISILGQFYFKDKENIYFKKSIGGAFTTLSGAEYKSFESIGDSKYGKDENNIYLDGKVFSGVDYNSFEVFANSEYAKDINNIYYNGKILQVFDKNSFEVFDSFNWFAKDKNYVYNCGNECIYYTGVNIINFNPLTFDSSLYKENIISLKDLEGNPPNDDDNQNDFLAYKYLGGYYMKKGNKVFYKNTEILGADYSSFVTFENNNNYAKDIKNIYYDGKIIKNADLNNFEIIDDNNAKNNINVYYKGMIYDFKVDVPSFEVLNSYFSRDKNNLYYSGTLFQGVNPNEVSIYGDSGYIKTNDKVFYLKDELEGVLKDSFQVFSKSYYAKDSEKVFYKKILLSGIDINSFEPIGDKGYSKDKDHLYYVDDEEKDIIEGVDINSFKIIDDYYAKDKNSYYLYVKKINSLSNNEGFLIFNNTGFSKDTLAVYYGTKNNGLVMLDEADTKNFQILGRSNYSKDDKNVYYKNQKLKGINVSDFQIIGDYGFARDKNNIFFQGVKLD